MSLLYMSARSKRLLDVLLAQSDYLSLNHLAKALDVSKIGRASCRERVSSPV